MGLVDTVHDFIGRASQPPLMRGNYKQGAQAIKKRSGHIRRDPSCGLCGVLFRPMERCFALLGDEQGMKYAGNTLPFPYNNQFERYDFVVGGLPGWSHCHAGYRGHDEPPCESAMLHTECFELFRRYCKHSGALDRLFRFAAWRKPWFKVPNLFLPEARTVPPLQAIEVMAKAYGLQQLAEVPIEIMFSIWNSSPAALLWRYALVMDIAEQLNALEEHPPGEMPLTDILSWDKGGDLVLSPGSHAGSWTLVKLDSRGIRSIERIATDSKRQYWQSHSQRYLVIRSPQPEMRAIVVDGLMRLKVDATHPDLLISDTPNIHDLPLPRDPRSIAPNPLTEHFCTINLARVTGMTLFFERGLRLAHIHGHTKERPFAEPPRELMTDPQLDDLRWIYVPLPKGERILSIRRAYGSFHHVAPDPPEETGLAMRPNFVFETNLAGSFAIGRRSVEESRRLKHSLAEKPNILIFKKRSWGSQRYCVDEPNLVGFPNFQQSDIDSVIESMMLQPLMKMDQETRPINTPVPMRGVISATVFTMLGDDLCQGILFYYKNGAQRSVGQCRLGHDESTTVEDPLFIEVTRVDRHEDIKKTQHGEVERVEYFGHRVTFHNTYSEKKAELGLQRLGTKWLNFRNLSWKHSDVTIFSEDEQPLLRQL